MAVYSSVVKQQVTTTPSAAERELDKILDELLRDSIFAPPSISTATAAFTAVAPFPTTSSPSALRRVTPASRSTAWNSRATSNADSYSSPHRYSAYDDRGQGTPSPPVPSRRGYASNTVPVNSIGAGLMLNGRSRADDGCRWSDGGYNSCGYFSDSEQLTNEWLQKQRTRLVERRRMQQQQEATYCPQPAAVPNTAVILPRYHRRSHSTSHIFEVDGDSSLAATSHQVNRGAMVNSVDNVTELVDRYEFRPVRDDRFKQSNRTHEMSYFAASVENFSENTSGVSVNGEGPPVPQRTNCSHEAVRRGRNVHLQTFQSPRPLTRQLSDLTFDKDRDKDETAWLRSLCLPQQQQRSHKSVHEDNGDESYTRNRSHSHSYNSSYNSRAPHPPPYIFSDFASIQPRRSTSLLPLPALGQDDMHVDNAVSMQPARATVRHLEAPNSGPALKPGANNDSLHYNAFPSLNSYDRELQAIQSPIPGKMSPVIGSSGAFKSQHNQAPNSSVEGQSSSNYVQQSSYYVSDDSVNGGYKTLADVTHHSRSISDTVTSHESNTSAQQEPTLASRRLDTLGHDAVSQAQSSVASFITFTDKADIYAKPIKRTAALTTQLPSSFSGTPSHCQNVSQQHQSQQQYEHYVQDVADSLQKQLQSNNNVEQQQYEASRTIFGQGVDQSWADQQYSYEQQWHGPPPQALPTQSLFAASQRYFQPLPSYEMQHHFQSHSSYNVQPHLQLQQPVIQSFQSNVIQPQISHSHQSLFSQPSNPNVLTDEDVTRFLSSLNAVESGTYSRKAPVDTSLLSVKHANSSTTISEQCIQARQDVSSKSLNTAQQTAVNSSTQNGRTAQQSESAEVTVALTRNEQYENKRRVNEGMPTHFIQSTQPTYASTHGSQRHVRTQSADAASFGFLNSQRNLLTVDRYGDGANLSRRSSTSSISSLTDSVDWTQQTPKFVHDTSKMWYKPNITRDEITRLLQDKPPGTFIVRDSTTYSGAFGLAVKVDQVPDHILAKEEDIETELIRHYLIEPTSKGVRIKGCTNEPTFASLAALIYQHSITALALPCKLLLADTGEHHNDIVNASSTALLSNGAACNVLFINSVDLESLTGVEAVQKVICETVKTGYSLTTAVVQLKASSSGITITDVHRRLFFRRHFPMTTISYAGVDPEGRGWKHSAEGLPPHASLKMFALVARKHSNTPDNVGHVFADIDVAQPASAIVSFIQKILTSQGKSFQS